MAKNIDNFILNRRKRGTDIYLSQMKTDTIKWENNSTNALLREPIEINEGKNKILEKNDDKSQKLNYLMLIIATMSFLSGLASTQIDAIQLQATESDSTGVSIFWLLFVLTMILEVITGIIVFYPPRKLRES